jgi:hypothetical protein
MQNFLQHLGVGAGLGAASGDESFQETLAG